MRQYIWLGHSKAQVRGWYIWINCVVYNFVSELLMYPTTYISVTVDYVSQPLKSKSLTDVQ